MKKKQPAKKGAAPFNEKNTGKFKKPAAGNRNRFSTDGERPGAASAKDNTSGDFRKRPSNGEGSPVRKRSFGKKPADNYNNKEESSFHGDFNKKSTDKSANRETPSGFNRKKFFDRTNDRFADKKDRFTDKKNDRSADKRSFTDKKHDRSADKRDDRSAGRKSFTDKRDDRSTDRKSFTDKRDDRSTNRKSFANKREDRSTDKQEKRRRHKIEKPGNGKTATKNPKEQKESVYGPGEMPLNKYIAHSGLCSRRKAVDYIKEGKVAVNGQTVTEPATKVTAKDNVTLQDKKLQITKNLVYILLNKPKGFITTTDDPEGRKTVMDLIKGATESERVYPVGRLDRNTSGLLLLTNDGELAQALAHPKHNIKKIYQVELDKPLTKADFEKIIGGVTLEDGVAIVDALGYVDPKDKKQIGIEIHSGKNRIVRRIFEHLEYTVEKLDRVMYAGLTKKNIGRGQWRHLTDKEVILLKHFKK
ncbi:MAG TPA: pseudouridine synthase [Chitinophaga sp.]|uniref:pseudouridine synthase n=1 Tax=Chitinophaga sp. TaxID=1869181 RepID=UPI002C731776|nr:pseudouridine synthase [Chitinophaga sp.]HVI45504.1 pseudouridine synthase [Chitinophaga sp.]